MRDGLSDTNEGSSRFRERLVPVHRFLRRRSLGKLSAFVAFRIAAEDFCVGRHNQLSPIAVSLPLRDHLNIDALLPKTFDAHRTQIALGEVR